MFWIGLIVGIVIGIFALAALSRWFCTRVMCNSAEEFDGVYDALVTATNNRECELRVVKNEEVLDAVTFEKQL